ncbi:MAG: selenocysteine-specific translation elongation factor [Actinobacteria bacterium]|nr:selenocysteine-specific translation elongation factor [Actinomycetota bacterium]
MLKLRPLVLGTAGHIDHGKTLLVKALTGIDTDRLAEEKKRGISIELGFAHLDLYSGQRLAVVDVPGHERFVRNMLAGASGIDLVLLVVAADDGVMPQTREHLAIVDLLGITEGVVAVTKSDLVDGDWLALVEEDVRNLLAETSLAGASIVAVSAKTGKGLDELRFALDEVVSEVKERRDDAPARLPVDRVFSMAGAGTVVTGTLWSGELAPDQLVLIQPSGRQARVRSIQVHGEKVGTAVAGQRVALNLVGLGKEEIERGDVVTAPAFLSPSFMIDVRFTLLRGARELKDRTRVRVHHGTKEALARIVLFDREALRPGESAFAQLRLEEPIVPRYGDRFVVRSYSPIETIGGGRVLDSHPAKHRKNEKGLFERLEVRLEGNEADLIKFVLGGAGIMSFADALKKTELTETLLKKVLRALAEGGEVIQVKLDKEYFSLASEIGEKEDAIMRRLSAFHKENPLSHGVAKQQLKADLFPKMPEREFDVLLSRLTASGRIILEGALAADPSAKVTLSAEDKALLEKIEERLKESGYSPPEVAELGGELKVEDRKLVTLLDHLAREKRAVRVSHEFYFGFESVEEAKRLLKERFADKEISVSEFRQLLGTSRKYALPLLNYFDTTGLTRRHGEARILR